MAFYDIFEELCANKGVTPTQAARDNGVPQSSVAMWKKRGSTPKAETVQKLADYFGVSPRELMGVDDSILSRIQGEQMLLTELLHRASKGELNEYSMRALSAISMRWSTMISSKMYEYMSQLNEIGQKKVEDYAGDLAEIPRYRAETLPQPTPAESPESEDE